MRKRSWSKGAAATVALLALASPAAKATALTADEANEIAVEAYHYFYPLLSMEITRRQMTNGKPGFRPGHGPSNQFQHMRAFPTADFKGVVRPNFDTLYSSAWLDLRKEPVIVSAPDTGGRYYLLPMLDHWTNVFAAPGKRTSGTAAGNFAVVPVGWKGKLPKGVERIESPTPYVWVVGRTQTNGTEDYAAVHKIQDGYRVTALSEWGKTAKPVKVVVDATVDMKTPPLEQVNGMTAAKYFTLATEIMKVVPPHVSDWSQITRLKRLGIEPGKTFAYESASPVVKAALERATGEGLKQMKAKVPTLAPVVQGWQTNTDTMGVYGDSYLKRAIVAMVGLGANQPEDAIYPLNIADEDGKPLEGQRKYRIHFAKEALPPVNAFWSVTMYDADGFQVPNPINRFAIGDRDKLQYNSDGSLDLYLQSESPGEGREANWLPSAASGKLGVTMRLYAPKSEALDGRWNPPPVLRQ